MVCQVTGGVTVLCARNYCKGREKTRLLRRDLDYGMLTLQARILSLNVAATLLENGDLWPRVCGSDLGDTQPCKFMPNIHRFFQRLPHYQRRQESTRERIPSPVGVYKLLFLEWMHRVGLDIRLIVATHHGCGFRTVCNDNRAGAGGVGLGEPCNCGGDGSEVFGLNAIRLCPRGSFGFVANDDVGVGQDLEELRIEELGDKRRGEVQGEILIWSQSMHIG